MTVRFTNLSTSDLNRAGGRVAYHETDEDEIVNTVCGDVSFLVNDNFSGFPDTIDAADAPIGPWPAVLGAPYFLWNDDPNPTGNFRNTFSKQTIYPGLQSMQYPFGVGPPNPLSQVAAMDMRFANAAYNTLSTIQVLDMRSADGSPLVNTAGVNIADRTVIGYACGGRMSTVSGTGGPFQADCTGYFLTYSSAFAQNVDGGLNPIPGSYTRISTDVGLIRKVGAVVSVLASVNFDLRTGDLMTLCIETIGNAVRLRGLRTRAGVTVSMFPLINDNNAARILTGRPGFTTNPTAGALIPPPPQQPGLHPGRVMLTWQGGGS